MQVHAAVLSAPRTPVAIEPVTVDPPQPGEVLVRYLASGVCRSDLHVVDGDWARPMPVVLGHEGTGVVLSTGSDVDSVRAGDRVVLSWMYPCGSCALCRSGRSWLCERSSAGEHVLADGTTRVRRPDGTALYQYLAIGTMAEAAVVPAAACVPISAEVPPEVAALIGCGVATGFGAVVNTAQVPAGVPVCVVGCGGVGLSAVMSAALVGADPIVAVDATEPALHLARAVGASHTVLADVDWTERMRRITGGVEYGFDCIGSAEVVTGLGRTLAPGGTLVLVGMTAQGETVAVDGYRFPDRGYRLLGSSYGSCVAALDFPKIAQLYLAGRLPLDRLVTRPIELTGVNTALQQMRDRAAGRAVIIM
ncbi:MAG: alcohol dehydrogenase catalytic domain-containing protein [Sporichthyaceae bacterium]|nr:alcohol dehydrogenase catalytic domain-containing protein [Sporichthyaceae bacterium]